MKLIVILLAAFILPVFLFPTLHRTHEYYGLENGIFLLAAVAAALSALPERTRVIATIGIVALQVVGFETTYRPALASDNGIRQFGAYIEAHTKPDDVLLVYGAEWSPVIPYYAKRKAIMIPASLFDEKRITLDKSGHWAAIQGDDGVWRVFQSRIGAIVDCREGPCETRFMR